MDINAIMQMVGTLGFPIVCAGACFWYINKQEERTNAERKDMTTAINNNTQALTQLIERLKGGDK